MPGCCGAAIIWGVLTVFIGLCCPTLELKLESAAGVDDNGSAIEKEGIEKLVEGAEGSTV
jgi:hypothetical protein